MFSIERQNPRLSPRGQQASPYVWMLLFAGLLLRIVLAPIWMGYDTDVNTFFAWADRAASNGLSSLYGNPKFFIDYPPGYIYILYLIGIIHKVLDLQWGSGASLIVLKLPAIIADLILSYIFYRLARSRGTFTLGQTLGVASLFVLSPAAWMNSAMWGQVDAFFMLFILYSLLLQQQGKLVKASIILALAILLKPQALLFGPFILIDVLRHRSWKLLGQCLLCGALTIVVMTLPFSMGKGYGWLFELYIHTLASYPYASLNAFNLLTLLGGNFIENSQKVFGISYQLIGLVMMIASLLYACYLYLSSKRQTGALLYVAFLFITAVFVLTTKMHERYLFYGLPLALASYVFIKDRRILVLFIGFSVTNVVNVADVLIPSFHKHYHIDRYDGLMMIFSAINVLLIGYASWLGWRLFVNKRQVSTVEHPLEEPGKMERRPVRRHFLQPPASDRDEHIEPEKGRFFTKKDLLYLGSLVVVYMIIALYHLGGHTDPQTYWKPSMTGEYVVADLGMPRTITRINSFAGVGEGEYSFWFSSDGKDFANKIEVKSDHTKVFTWNTVEPKLSARYVKIVADKTDFYMHEVGIFGDQGTAPLPISSINSSTSQPKTEGTPEAVFDEQATVPYTPTFMEGSYFDEIYHARTAYEHLHQIEPYENTHPPLGKILIAAGIWLFGLNPFGWRIVGTLFGVGMIPVIYLFGKRLFRRSEYAFIASFLLTFDFMHFAQTRIATIDVYGVFFIMLMFYFMYRYTTLSFYRQSLFKTLVPLSLSGLFFGIGSASKWIVIYGGAGLALLLLLTLIERYWEYRKARYSLSRDAARGEAVLESTMVLPTGAMEPVGLISEEEEADNGSPEQEPSFDEAAGQPRLTDEEKGHLQRIVRIFPKYTFFTIAWCVVMFVLIPGLIYFLSYIPFMMVPGPGHGWKDVITYQKHMYDYHKNLHATHPFSSSWWEWPLMLRPIWYYQGHLLPEGKLSSIISFGNPLVWWPGFLAVLLSFYTVFRYKDKKLRTLLIAYCSQYLPWILVPRLTFIYHYFAMVPFLILILTYYIKVYVEGKQERQKWVYIYLAAVSLLFVMFYPILSGVVIPKIYSYLLRWLPGWNFF
jgi:dolichyl-phosphate-mannose-protein mannosyltransferase